MQRSNYTADFNTIGTQRAERLLEQLRKAAAFIKKDMKISLSYRLQFVFQFFQIFFAVAVIYFIGKMLSGTGKTSIIKEYGADYFSFALVGLAVNSYLRAGLISITNDIRQIINQGTLEAMCAAPINYPWLVLCSSLWQFIFETIRIAFYFVIAVSIFGMRLTKANWPGAIFTLALTAPVFLMLGTISSSILVVVKRGDPINWSFSSLCSLLAGTMFPVSVLPSWLQTVALYLPLTHSLEAARRCLLAGEPLSRVSGNMWALFCFTVVLTPVTILVSNKCMRIAKKRGAFSTH